MRHKHKCLACLAVMLFGSLTGCNAFLSEGTADIAGIAGGSLAGVLTENAAAASGIGLAVRSLAAAGLDYAEREIQDSEQLAIAQAAGPLDRDEIADWDVGNLPTSSAGQGRVSVARSFTVADTVCKEIVFSVNEEDETHYFVAMICQADEQWRWASAEPATTRWGALQ